MLAMLKQICFRMASERKKDMASGKCLCPFIFLKSLRTPANAGLSTQMDTPPGLGEERGRQKEQVERVVCALRSPFFPRPSVGREASPSRQSALARWQGTSLRVCVWMSQCCVFLSLVWSRSKLVTFLFALSKEDNQCLSEKNPGSLC